MIVYPEIAINNGRCVTLRKGQMILPEVYEGDPVTTALGFEEQGAEWVHVVDLDAKGRHKNDNTQVISEIIRRLEIPVQVAGGIYKPWHVDCWIDNGAECVVFGKAAYLGPGVVRRAAERHPFRVLVAVDVKDGEVMIDGWMKPTGVPTLTFLRQFDNLCLAGFIVNDYDYDIDSPDASMALIAELARHLKTPVIATGVVKSLDHLSTLKYLGNIAGAVIGRGLHQSAFHLEHAQRIVLESQPIAEMLRGRPEATRLRQKSTAHVDIRIVEKGISLPEDAPFVRIVESHH